jgi:hypothetical protein
MQLGSYRIQSLGDSLVGPTGRGVVSHCPPDSTDERKAAGTAGARAVLWQWSFSVSLYFRTVYTCIMIKQCASTIVCEQKNDSRETWKVFDRTWMQAMSPSSKHLLLEAFELDK